jgi:putative membrane protein insertion efficiency factor
MCEQKEIAPLPGNVDLIANPRDLVIIQRHLFGKTADDIEIESLAIPKTPLWLCLTIKLIRFYQRSLSEKLGNRCVFDPSCSHYAEMAFRKKGFVKGLSIAIQRLRRCHGQNGGVDQLI